MDDTGDDKDSRTIFCGNLSDQVTEELLYELFLQAGPLEEVSLPKNKDGSFRQFGFITYAHKVSVPYAIQLFIGTRLFHRELNLQARCPQLKLQGSLNAVNTDRGMISQQQSGYASQDREKPWLRQSSSSYKQHSRRDDRGHNYNKPYERNRSPQRNNRHRDHHDDRRYNNRDERRRR